MTFAVLDEFSGFFAQKKEGSAFVNTQMSQSFDLEFSSIVFQSEAEAEEGELKLHGCDSCGQLVVLLLSGWAECDADKKMCEKCIRYNADGKEICKECHEPEQVIVG